MLGLVAEQITLLRYEKGDQLYCEEDLEIYEKFKVEAKETEARKEESRV